MTIMAITARRLKKDLKALQNLRSSGFGYTVYKTQEKANLKCKSEGGSEKYNGFKCKKVYNSLIIIN
jgi:hypothetical protein